MQIHALTKPNTQEEMLPRFYAFVVTSFAWFGLSGMLTLIGLVVLPSTDAPGHPDPDSMGATVALVNRAGILLLFFSVLSWFVLFPLPLRRSGQTCGMKLLGLKLVNKSGGHPSWSSLLLRSGILVALNMSVIGALVILGSIFQKKNRPFWDRIAQTAVVSV